MEEEISERNSNGKDDNQGEKEDNKDKGKGREEKAGMKRTKGKERAETEERRRSRSHCGFVSGFVLATDHRHKPHFKNIQNYFPSCDPDPHDKDADTHTYILKLILIQFWYKYMFEIVRAFILTSMLKHIMSKSTLTITHISSEISSGKSSHI